MPVFPSTAEGGGGCPSGEREGGGGLGAQIAKMRSETDLVLSWSDLRGSGRYGVEGSEEVVGQDRVGSNSFATGGAIVRGA